jgi:adenylosuccinate lyase
MASRGPIQGPALLETLATDVEVTSYLSREALEELTSTDFYVRYIDTAFKRIGL